MLNTCHLEEHKVATIATNITKNNTFGQQLLFIMYIYK